MHTRLVKPILIPRLLEASRMSQRTLVLPLTLVKMSSILVAIFPISSRTSVWSLLVSVRRVELAPCSCGGAGGGAGAGAGGGAGGC